VLASVVMITTMRKAPATQPAAVRAS